MKISYRISKRRNQNFNVNHRDVGQIHDNNNNQEDSINFSNSINFTDTITSSLTNFTPSPTGFQGFEPDDNSHPFDTNPSWRIPAILGLVWTVILMLAVFLFIIKKTVLSNYLEPDTEQQQETNPENEWMIASFNESESENVELPLTTRNS